jgi:hypothetical protein
MQRLLFLFLFAGAEHLVQLPKSPFERFELILGLLDTLDIVIPAVSANSPCRQGFAS